MEVAFALVALAVQAHSQEQPAGKSSFASKPPPCQLLQQYRVLQASILAGACWTEVGFCCSLAGCFDRVAVAKDYLASLSEMQHYLTPGIAAFSAACSTLGWICFWTL